MSRGRQHRHVPVASLTGDRSRSIVTARTEIHVHLYNTASVDSRLRPPRHPCTKHSSSLGVRRRLAAMTSLAATVSPCFHMAHYGKTQHHPQNRRDSGRQLTGNESVPKIIMSDTNNFFKLQSAFWQFQTITVSECCLIKFLPCILFEQYIYVVALDVARTGN